MKLSRSVNSQRMRRMRAFESSRPNGVRPCSWTGSRGGFDPLPGVDEAGADGDVRDVGHPELVRTVHNPVAGEVREDGPVVVAVGRLTSLRQHRQLPPFWLRTWCGTALARRACRDGLSAAGPVDLLRVVAGGASPFAALCGRTSNLYPTPGTERMNRGAFGSGSILRRRRATSISTLRS